MPSMMENILMRKCNLTYKKAKKTVGEARLNLSLEKQSLLWSKELEVECLRMVDEERKNAAEALEEEFNSLRPTIIRHGDGEERFDQRSRDLDGKRVPDSPQTPKVERSRELSSTPSAKQRKRGKSAGIAPGRRIQLSPQKKSTLKKIGSDNEDANTDSFSDNNLHHSARSKSGPSLSSALMRKDTSRRMLDESSQLTGSTNDTCSTGSSANVGAKQNSRFCRSKRETDGRRRSYSPLKTRTQSGEGSKENLDFTNIDEIQATKTRRSSLRNSPSRKSATLSPSKKPIMKKDGEHEKQLGESSDIFEESPTKKVKKKKKKKKDKILGHSATEADVGGGEPQLLSEPTQVTNTLSPSKSSTKKEQRHTTKKSPRRKSIKINKLSMISGNTVKPTFINDEEEEVEIPQELLDAFAQRTTGPMGRHSFTVFEKSKSSPSKTKRKSALGRESNDTDNSLKQDSIRSLRSSPSRPSKTRMVPVVRTSPRSPSRTRDNSSRLNDSIRSCGTNASRKFKSHRRPSDFELSDSTFTLSPSKAAQEKYSSFSKSACDSPESLLSLESFSASKSDAFGSFDSPSTSDTSRTLPCVPSLSPLGGPTLSSTTTPPRQPKRQVSNTAAALAR